MFVFHINQYIKLLYLVSRRSGAANKYLNFEQLTAGNYDKLDENQHEKDTNKEKKNNYLTKKKFDGLIFYPLTGMKNNMDGFVEQEFRQPE